MSLTSLDRLREGITGLFRQEALVVVDPEVEGPDEGSLFDTITKIIAGIVFPPLGLAMLLDLFLDTELESKVEDWFGLNYDEIALIVLGIAFPPLGMAMLVKLFLDTELGEKVKGWFYRNWASMFWAIAGIAFPPLGMALLVKLFPRHRAWGEGEGLVL